LGWQGDAAGTNPIVALTMNGPRTVSAVFGHTLTISTTNGANGASGMVSNAPAGPLYAYGQTVLLSGLPAPNSLLAGWGHGGVADFTVNPLPFVVDENHTDITAYFQLKPQTNLLLNVTITGAGVVTRDPDASSYPSNSFVALGAVAATNYVFDRWQGDATGNQNPLTVQMTSNLNVQALFTNRVPPVVALLSPQDGTVIGPTNLSLVAIASSSNSILQRLEFYDGTNLLVTVAANVASLTNTVVLTNLPPRTNAYLFFVRAVDARGVDGFSGTATVTNQAAPDYVTFGFLPTPISVPEYSSYVQVRVFKFGQGTGSVSFATQAITAQPVINGIGDFVATNGTLTFLANQTYQDILVYLQDDNVYEGDETFAIRLVPLGRTGLTGSDRYLITIVESTYQSSDSYTNRLAPPLPSPATNSLRVWLQPSGALGQWRFVWENTWRTNGTAQSNLVAGNYDVEFRPVVGFAPLPTLTVQVPDGGEKPFTNYYLATGQPPTGAINVHIFPSDLNASWRIIDDPVWKSPGDTLLQGLAEGDYTLEFNSAINWIEPDRQPVHVWAGQQTDVTVTYTPVEPSPGGKLTLTALPNYGTIRDSATNQPSLPYAWVGQLRAGGVWGSGFAVRDRVVVTAGHVVFDSVRLAPAGDIYWFAQREAGEYEPKPIQPRGWLLLDGYAAALAGHQDAQNQDAAALYFSSAAVRGGYSGYLADDHGAWLINTTNHMLVGYPTHGSADVTQNRDKMFATLVANYHFSPFDTNNPSAIFVSTNFVGFPGASGGPLCVLSSNTAWYPAGVYLGITGNGSARVRAIDGPLVHLIQQAVAAANAEQNQADNGPAISISGVNVTTNRVKVTINVDPPALLTTLQSLHTNLWCEVGLDFTNVNHFAVLTFTNALSLTTSFDVSLVKYIQFAAVQDWQSPVNVSVSLSVGNDVTIHAQYESNAPPRITLDPTTIFGLPGGTAAFRASAVGAGPLAFQWLENGQPISRATNSSLQFLLLNPANAGWYSLRVANAFGAATSAPAGLVIGPLLQWQGTNLFILGTAGRTVRVDTATQIRSTGVDWTPLRTNVVIDNQQLLDTSGWLNRTQQSGFLRVYLIP